MCKALYSSKGHSPPLFHVPLTTTSQNSGGERAGVPISQTKRLRHRGVKWLSNVILLSSSETRIELSHLNSELVTYAICQAD